MGSWYVTEVSKNKFIIYNNPQLQSGDSGMPHCLQHGIGSIGCYNITAYFLQEMTLVFQCCRLNILHYSDTLLSGLLSLTNWGWVMHKCISRLTIIGSDNGLLPDRCQAIIWKKCWNITDWTLGNTLQWNLNKNSYIVIQEKALKNVIV